MNGLIDGIDGKFIIESVWLCLLAAWLCWDWDWLYTFPSSPLFAESCSPCASVPLLILPFSSHSLSFCLSFTFAVSPASRFSDPFAFIVLSLPLASTLHRQPAASSHKSRQHAAQSATYMVSSSIIIIAGITVFHSINLVVLQKLVLFLS